MLELGLTVALQVVSWIISKNQDNKEMMLKYYEHIKNIQLLYGKSVHLRDDAKARLAKINEEAWKETT